MYRKLKKWLLILKKVPSSTEPLIINNEEVEIVNVFKFLGCLISNDLKWTNHIDDILKKAQQRMYFLRQLKSFRVSKRILINFYQACIESILTNSILVWYNAACKKDTGKLDRVVKNASYLIGQQMDSIDGIYHRRVGKRTGNIMNDDLHPGNELLTFIPSGRRLRSYIGTDRFLDSFYPSAVRIFNPKWCILSSHLSSF